LETLNIYFNTQKIGALFYHSHTQEFGLKYSDEWKKIGFPISLKLGFNEDFNSYDIKNYIENLLPEGEGLEKLVSLFQISKANKYSLLEAIGKDTSGALSFIRNDIEKESKFREITHDELSNRIKQRDKISIVIWDEKPRLSVAGVQEKLPICKIKGKYGLGEGSLSSTHILKFNKGEDNLVLNEYTSLYLAKTANIAIPNIEIIDFDGELVLEVERFDRIIVDDKYVKKLHVIDSCQALGFPPSFKYERNYGTGRDVKDIRQGVSFSKLDKLAKTHGIVPILIRAKILDWTIVNLILGNSDAHGKNISYFISPQGIELTPFYDIVNIFLYDGKYETTFAMAIDDEFDVNKLGAYDIAIYCYGIGIVPKVFNDSFKRISKAILKEFKTGLIVEKISKYDADFIIKYELDITKRITFLQEICEVASKIKKSEI